ncbi:hypothetical protein Afil01_41440 [Actinorhabdospora filicis]|uniref:Helix-hairpin-helix DNA-binding motif class 1 domain-containing protein n=1 Tax=Actinorhabdospora filicis TaxID=1785913 RepID=A0A9W6SP62_9ACTN|nr:ComEA family DNA-binding protein [Actinorhabdospora filicis]GLZ79337.1 hypothetical protein Afil01_41440 [Actinorhabdospora filicis]
MTERLLEVPPSPDAAEVSVLECDARRRARWDVPPRTRLVLAVLGGVALLAGGGLAWWSWPRAEPVAPVVEVAESVPSAVPLVVSVAGKVRRPGLVRLPPGSRVADAVAAAGGVADEADLGLLNLARKVADGELIVVGGPPVAQEGGAAGPLNLNAATAEQLDALPGVGPVLARRIVDYRDAHGGFGSVEELRQVDGIGASRFADLRELVTV